MVELPFPQVPMHYSQNVCLELEKELLALHDSWGGVNCEANGAGDVRGVNIAIRDIQGQLIAAAFDLDLNIFVDVGVVVSHN